VTPPDDANANIARYLAFMATNQPDTAALKIPRGRTAEGKIDYLTLTFAELDTEVDAWCARLTARGVQRGDRTLVMVRQGLPLIAAVFALFKLAAVPVVIDPGMGLKSFLACVERSHPRVMIGIRRARLMGWFFRRAFRTVQVRIPASDALTGRLTSPRSKPKLFVQAIQQENVTTSFGSPTLWRKIGEHCTAQKITLPSLRRVLCAGAPVPAQLWKTSVAFLPNGLLHSPYGATEALPVSTISTEEIFEVHGLGACVGRPLAGIDVKVIALTDERIATIVEGRELRCGEIGEFIVRGPVVTKSYDENPPATTATKIAYAQNFTNTGVWHRMGDCGYFDADGRLWFCGRKVERVEMPQGTLHTEPCEQVFRTHPRVTRCALIACTDRRLQRPALVVEAAPKDAKECIQFARELRALALGNEYTKTIRTFFFRPEFPVDVRHNAKIHRLTLAKWAASAKGYEIES
jgi:acyl-CoA synthetase (AMP-forming)/AMP-acid ligase II